MVTGERSEQRRCAWCGGEADGSQSSTSARPACSACRTALERLPLIGLEPGPVRCATPFADLGMVSGLRVHLLSVEQWASHGELRVGYCGPAGWVEREPGPTQGRWEITGADGVVVAGLPSGGGGSEDLSVTAVELPPLDGLPLPWSIRLHRNGTESAATTVTDLRDRADLRPNVLRPLTPSEDAGEGPACRICTTPMDAAGRVCGECRASLDAWGRVLDANSWVTSPTGQVLVFDVGSTPDGSVSILAIEAWPGWFAVRVHLTGEWDALHLFDSPGAWTAADDRGHAWRGFVFHQSGGGTGLAQDLAFVGEVDPRATLLSLTVTIRGTVALEVDLPIEPDTWPGT